MQASRAFGWFKDKTFIIVVGLALASLCVCQAFAQRFALALPPGFDHELWALTVRNLEVGAQPMVPPVYPALVALLRTVVDLPLLDAGGWISGLAHLLVAPGCFVLARRLGAPVWAATVAGLCCLGVPELTAMGLRYQPDALTALALLVAVWVAERLVRSGDNATVFGVVAVCAVLPLIREHGWGLAVVLIAFCGLSPGAWTVRLGRAWLGLMGFLLGPLLFGIPLSLPWHLPWAGRIQMMITDMMSGRLPKGGTNLNTELQAQLAQAAAQQDWLTLCTLQLQTTLAQAPEVWAWFALGLGCAVSLKGKQRWVPLVALLPVLPALFVFSQSRHVVVAVPVAIACWAAAMGRRTKVPRAILALVGLCVAGWQWSQFTVQGAAAQRQVQRLERIQAFGLALCEQVAPGDLYAGEPAAVLFCPMPVNIPTDEHDGASWKVWWVGAEPRSGVWQEVPLGAFMYRAYRLEPGMTGADRPCSASVPPENTPFLSTPPRRVILQPPCDPSKTQDVR